MKKIVFSPSRAKLVVSLWLTLVGTAVLVYGVVAAPAGEIHSSVLVAFGECMTFAAALAGVRVTAKGGAIARRDR